VVASIGFGKRHGPVLPPLVAGAIPMTPPTAPNNVRLDEMEGRAGCLLFDSTIAQTEAMFPVATHRFGVQQVAALVCSSCLVGMVAPGLHSLFAGLDVSFSDDVATAAGTLQFAVIWVEPRFRLVRIGVRGGGLHGSLEAVSRLPPVMQPRMASVA